MLDLQYSSACRIAGNFIIPGYEREDIQQEAAMTLLSLVDHPKAADKGYVAMSVRNRLINLQHRANFLDVISIDAPISHDDEGELTLADTLADPGPSPEDQVIESEFRSAVGRAVDSLPTLDAQVVRLHLGIGQLDGIGRSLRQAAQLLSITADKAERSWKRSITALQTNYTLMEVAA